MKGKKRAVTVLVFLFMVCTMTTVWAMDMEASQGREMVIEEEQTVSEDIFTTANSIINKGMVQGDMVVATPQFQNFGTIEKDLILGAQKAEIGGEIQGDVRLIALDIINTSVIGGNATIVASNFVQGQEGVIEGNLRGFGEQAEIQGRVKGNIGGYYEKITINALVEGDVEVFAQEVILGPKADIEGSIIYTSDLNISQLEGAKVGGVVQRKDPPIIENNVEMDKAFRFFGIVGKIVSLLSIMLIGVLLVLIAPKKSGDLGHTIQSKPLQTIGVGILGLILIPILGIFALITIVGIPIGIILTILYLFTLYLGRVVLGIWVGQNILRKEKNPLFHVLLGTLILTLGGFIPYVGTLVKIAASVMGMGAVLMVTYQSWKKGRDKE